VEERISHDDAHRQFPAIAKGLGVIEEEANKVLDKRLVCLLQIRSSQINRCGFCLDMHFEEAIKSGEEQRRLDVLPAWREVPWFSKKEKAALNWCELLTDLPNNRVTDDDFNVMRANFSEHEILVVTAMILNINSWNRVVAAMHFIPERKEEGKSK
jgi:AhpD family alkylhydroperoxidase